MSHPSRGLVAALILALTVTSSAGTLAQSPAASPSPVASPAASACPELEAATLPLHDETAVVTLAFAAPNPDTATGGFHPGDDWALPDTPAGTPVFAIGDGQILAVEPAAPGGHGGLVAVRHGGPFELPASAEGAPSTYPAATEDALVSVYAGIDPAPSLAAGTCVTGDTTLGTITATCGADVPDPCSDRPAALHLELRLGSTVDPAAPTPDWWTAGTPEDTTDGWFHDAQRMVEDGLRDPSAVLAALAAGDPLAGLDGLLGTDGRLTVLLLGSDHFNAACKERGRLEGERTDTILFATINPRNGKVAMASLPRDTIQVPIGPGQVYTPKITGLFAQLLATSGSRKKALHRMVEAMEAFSGVEIDYYGLTYFCGVKDVVDAIGGIDVTLAAPLVDPTMHIGKHGLKLKAGRRHLDGGLALAFSRSRHSDSDYARARRQQQVILATLDKIRSMGLEAVPALLGLATGKVAKKLARFQTDFPVAQAGNLWDLLGRAKLSSAKSTVLAPPTYETEGTGTLLYSNIPDMTAIRAYFARVFGPVTP